ENKLYGINGSGRAPLSLSYEQMKAELAKLHRETIPPTGMLPISVPGTVDAWAELHKRFGKLKLSDDLAPAIRYAEEGFPVTELIAYYWAFGPRLYKGLPGAFLETYTLDGKGRTPAKGDISRIQHSRKPCDWSLKKVATLFIKARSQTKSTSSCKRMAGSCGKPISKNIRRPGSSRSRRVIAATTFSSFRQTARASRPCRC